MLPLTPDPDPWSSTVATDAVWLYNASDYDNVTVNFDGELTPAPSLNALHWAAWAEAPTAVKFMLDKDYYATTIQVRGKLKRTFIPNPDPPRIQYNPTVPDLYGADGKPIQPFTVPLYTALP